MIKPYNRTKAIKVFRIITINVITVLLLLMVINWFCGLYLRNAREIRKEDLPNFAHDYEHAKQVFQDYAHVRQHFQPFVDWKALPFYSETVTINEDGVRINPAFTEKGEKAAHFFGGSAMWGESSDDQHTIPELFRQENPEYSVFNHGQIAYNSRQDLDALITLYQTGENPDLVVFYNGVNDASFLCLKEIDRLPGHWLVPVYSQKIDSRKFSLVKEALYKMFIRNIMDVIREVTYKETAQQALYDCVGNPEKAERIAEMLIKTWEIAHDIVVSRNGKFIAILQPIAHAGRPQTKHLVLDHAYGENHKMIYSILQQKIKERNHSWAFDFTSAFDSDEYILTDFCHASPNGNKIIAHEISKLNDSKEMELVRLK